MEKGKIKKNNISPLGEIFLYFNTIRYLKPIQIVYRVRRSFFKPKKAEIISVEKRSPETKFLQPIPKPQTMFSPNTFKFLNTERKVQIKEDWNNPDWERLWLYNLHYFDDLNSKNAQERKEWHQILIQRWIEENFPDQSVGWQPYPSSLRIVNWIKWDLTQGKLDERMLESLASQTNYLSKNLEFHLLGNHLLSNSKALIFSGCFFSGEKGEGWLEKGKKILEKELDEQILKDGGHFELSPMYHNIVLEDLLDIYNILRTYGKEGPKKLEEKIKKMHEWSMVMRHEDNDIPFFNDATLNSSPHPLEIDKYFERLGFNDRGLNNKKVFVLDNSGYIKIKQDYFSIITDVGKIGPDYLPGHGHADALSFEISFGSKRFLVNSGISTYENNSKRITQRQGRSHNSLEIGGQSSSEIWDSFRVARRISNSSHSIEIDNGNQILVKGSHNGFKRLRGVGTHERKWIASDNRLIIKDIVLGRGSHFLKFFFHLYPGFQVIETGFNHFTITTENLVIAKLFFDSGLNLERNETSFNPEFGKEIPQITFESNNRVKLPCEFTTLEIVYSKNKGSF